MRTKTVTYLLLCLSITGICGLNHLYLGHYKRAILWFLTLGLLGCGLLMDIFMIPEHVRAYNRNRR